LNKLFTVYHYLKYFFIAKGKHALHSPFVYDFYNKVIKGSASQKEFIPIEKIRAELKNNKQKIQLVDFGAGSRVDKSSFRIISSISKNSEKKPWLAALLFRIIQFQKPAVIVDLGTSFGVTTLYESIANPLGKVVSFEGCPNTAKVAEANFNKLKAKNISLIIGNIEETLPQFLQKQTSVDFVFFDANHRYAPTVRYFNWCLEKADENSIFVFDDIYWSPEMKKAWEEIKRHQSVRLSIDLFFIGILFFRKKQPVQHFILK
jgi:predicted O-methyltransferase YrrM